MIFRLKIFIMSPCHFVFIRSLALGSMKQYETPLGMLNIDLESNH